MSATVVIVDNGPEHFIQDKFELKEGDVYSVVSHRSNQLARIIWKHGTGSIVVSISENVSSHTIILSPQVDSYFSEARMGPSFNGLGQTINIPLGYPIAAVANMGPKIIIVCVNWNAYLEAFVFSQAAVGL